MKWCPGDWERESRMWRTTHKHARRCGNAWDGSSIFDANGNYLSGPTKAFNLAYEYTIQTCTTTYPTPTSAVGQTLGYTLIVEVCRVTPRPAPAPVPRSPSPLAGITIIWLP